MARAKRRKVQERRMEKDRKTGVARREGMNGKREKARNVWRFGVMRFNYKTRRVLQLARRRTPHPSPPLPPPVPAAPTRASLAPFPFRRSAVIYGLIRLIFPATPNSTVLSLVFLASARTPKTTPSPHRKR